MKTGEEDASTTSKDTEHRDFVSNNPELFCRPELDYVMPNVIKRASGKDKLILDGV